MPPTVIAAQGLSKSFGAVRALRNATLTLEENEVHALVGDNGAGKSTFVKILSGVFPSDGGELLLDGRAATIADPRTANELGIATVFQNLALVDHLDVSGNLFLGNETRRRAPLRWVGVLDKKAMRRKTISEMQRLKIGLGSVDQLVRGLSGGQRQAIAVARAVAWGTRVIIMDEPTAALGVRESAAVLELIGEVRRQGVSVLMISHNLPEVFAVADRVTVFRLGETIATLDVKDTSPDEVVGLITGATARGAPTTGAPAR
jgi:simple sugar transport system ATP-binding protein